MGHSLRHTLQRDRPLREGARDGALPEAAAALIRHGYAEPLRNGMTATGSHEYFYSLRGAQPPGEGYFLRRRRLPSKVKIQTECTKYAGNILHLK